MMIKWDAINNDNKDAQRMKHIKLPHNAQRDEANSMTRKQKQNSRLLSCLMQFRAEFAV